MPKSFTLPTLYDDLKTINILFLKKYGYLTTNQEQSGQIIWSIRGNTTGSIAIVVNTKFENSYLELDYKCGETPIKYTVQLISLPSNLGKGVVWYFVCPKTKMRCRKLYLINTYFYHRKAFKNCMYETQTYSSKTRGLIRKLGDYLQIEKLFEQLYKKHLKKQYAGKPTKKYLKLTQQIERAESIPYDEIEQILKS